MVCRRQHRPAGRRGDCPGLRPRQTVLRSSPLSRAPCEVEGRLLARADHRHRTAAPAGLHLGRGQGRDRSVRARSRRKRPDPARPHPQWHQRPGADDQFRRRLAFAPGRAPGEAGRRGGPQLLGASRTVDGSCRGRDRLRVRPPGSRWPVPPDPGRRPPSRGSAATPCPPGARTGRPASVRSRRRRDDGARTFRPAAGR